MRTVVAVEEKGWSPDLRSAIETGGVRTFGTQKQAIEASVIFGWGRRVFKVERRFERVWMVGVLDFQPEIQGDLQIQTLRVPLLRYDTGADGVKYQPVVTFRRPYQGEINQTIRKET